MAPDCHSWTAACVKAALSQGSGWRSTFKAAETSVSPGLGGSLAADAAAAGAGC
jgi:hypothetical protein